MNRSDHPPALLGRLAGIGYMLHQSERRIGSGIFICGSHVSKRDMYAYIGQTLTFRGVTRSRGGSHNVECEVEVDVRIRLYRAFPLLEIEATGSGVPLSLKALVCGSSLCCMNEKSLSESLS